MSNQTTKNFFIELAEACVKPENQRTLKIITGTILGFIGLIGATMGVAIGIAAYCFKKKPNTLKKKLENQTADNSANQTLIGDDKKNTQQNQNEQEEEKLKALIQLDRVERKIQNFYDRTEKMNKEIDDRNNVLENLNSRVDKIAQDQTENRNDLKKIAYNTREMEISNDFYNKRNDVSKKTSEFREKISEINAQISKIYDEISLITEQQTSRAINRFDNICSIGFGFEDIQKENLETRKEEINQRILEINGKFEKLQKLESDQPNQIKSLNKLIKMTNNEINKDEIEKRTKLENEKSELEKEKSEIEKGLLLIQEESLKKLAKQKENQENQKEIEKLEAQKKEKEKEIEEKQKEIKEIEKEIENLKIEEEKEIERLNKEEKKILENLKRDFENNTGVFEFYNRTDLSKDEKIENNFEKKDQVSEDALNEKDNRDPTENLNVKDDQISSNLKLNNLLDPINSNGLKGKNKDDFDLNKTPNKISESSENLQNTNISSQVLVNESNPDKSARPRRNSEIIVGEIDNGVLANQANKQL